VKIAPESLAVLPMLETRGLRSVWASLAGAAALVSATHAGGRPLSIDENATVALLQEAVEAGRCGPRPAASDSKLRAASWMG